MIKVYGVKKGRTREELLFSQKDLPANPRWRRNTVKRLTQDGVTRVRFEGLDPATPPEEPNKLWQEGPAKRAD